MSSNRVFKVLVKLDISGGEAYLVKEYLRAQGKAGEIGTLLEPILQEHLDKLVAQATTWADRKEA